jgi:hypothetical protein
MTDIITKTRARLAHKRRLALRDKHAQTARDNDAFRRGITQGRDERTREYTDLIDIRHGEAALMRPPDHDVLRVPVTARDYDVACWPPTYLMNSALSCEFYEFHAVRMVAGIAGGPRFVWWTWEPRGGGLQSARELVRRDWR